MFEKSHSGAQTFHFNSVKQFFYQKKWFFPLWLEKKWLKMHQNRLRPRKIGNFANTNSENSRAKTKRIKPISKTWQALCGAMGPKDNPLLADKSFTSSHGIMSVMRFCTCLTKQNRKYAKSVEYILLLILFSRFVCAMDIWYDCVELPPFAILCYAKCTMENMIRRNKINIGLCNAMLHSMSQFIVTLKEDRGSISFFFAYAINRCSIF